MLKKKCFTIIISALTAFIILTLFCCVYYNIPVHSKNHNGATDYSWESNVLYSSLTEGFGYGKTNNEGYMNVDDYNGQSIDVLIMGSSHLQGLAIPIKKNCSYLLDEMLDDRNVYNISVAGHNFKTCISNLDSAINRYKPSVVVVETSSVSISDEEVDAIINKEIEEIESVENTIINFLQHNQLLRLAYSQIKSFSNNNQKEENKIIKENSKTDVLIEYVSNILLKHNCKGIIIYHPVIDLNNENIVKTNNNLNSFQEECAKNNIYFIDMSNKYIKEYEVNYTLPTGFFNTSIGVGHLNTKGHRMFAEELNKAIKEIEQ